MRNARLWQRVLGLVRTVVEGVEFDEDADAVVVSVRPCKGGRRRCGRCGRRAPWYDRGEGSRRWRGLDLGTVRVLLEAEAPRVNCPTHGPTVVQVPWARHGAGHTYAFDDTVAWLAVQCSKTAVTELMRIAWRTVGSIITRVQVDVDATVDRLAGLRRIGIDEISYKRGYKFLTVVVDHDSGHLVWAKPGRDDATLHSFFDALGEDRCAQITHISADAADWIERVVKARCANAVRCADPFHVVAWATDALDEVRRQAWNDARAQARSEPRRPRGRPRADTPHQLGHRERARAITHARYALWKNPENLTESQHDKLAWIAKTDPRLHRAYLLKEGLRTVFVFKGDAGKEALDRWICWARRCRIPAFVKLQRRIVKHRAAIDAALDHGLSNALIESTNTKIRLLTRVAFGFHGPEPLIALAMLALGGHKPNLPHRQ
ncbi:MAG TPA: ISL3 family transposase [Jiangellaceae bacterium]